jgi:hypothetical protein
MTQDTEAGFVEPVYCRVPPDELEALHRAREALESVTAMATEAFNRGKIFEPTHVPMIALAGKIMQEGSAGLGR